DVWRDGLAPATSSRCRSGTARVSAGGFASEVRLEMGLGDHVCCGGHPAVTVAPTHTSRAGQVQLPHGRHEQLSDEALGVNQALEGHRPYAAGRGDPGVVSGALYAPR